MKKRVLNNFCFIIFHLDKSFRAYIGISEAYMKVKLKVLFFVYLLILLLKLVNYFFFICLN